MTIGAYWLLAVFLYSYFVLVPSLLPEARAAAQARLLYFVQWNRLLLLAGMGAAVWFARGTDWRLTYLRLAVGVGIGFVLRIGTNQAIARGDYQVGSFHDLAWIAPWLCYAWAAAEAPASPLARTRKRRSSRGAVGGPAGRARAPDSAHRLQRPQSRVRRATRSTPSGSF